MAAILNFLYAAKYWGIFGFFLIGVFGPPFPDEFLLILIGYLSWEGSLDFLSSLGVISAGSVGGIMVDYLLGRFSLYFFRQIKVPRARRLARRVKGVQDLVKLYGSGLVVCSYFLPGLRHLVPLAAGMLQVRPALVGVGAGCGALLWSVAYLSLGYLLASRGVSGPAAVPPSLYLALPGAAFLLLTVWLLKRKYRGENLLQVQGDSDPDMSPVL